MPIKKSITYCVHFTLFALISFYGWGQSPVLTTSIYNQGQQELNNMQWVYYKDFDNDLDPFVGVYELTNNHFSWKIELRKKLMSKSNWEYEDVIFGEYQYKIGNVVLYNSIPNIDMAAVAEYPWDFSSIGIGYIAKYPDNPMCRICTTNGEKFITIYMRDRNDKRSCKLFMRLITVDGQTALEIDVFYEHGIQRASDPIPTETPALPPHGQYVLLKQ